jgi:DNA-binding XRE family transcriptional regulator
MGRTLEAKLRSLPKRRRARIEARAAELVAEEMSLRDLRKALDLTQVRMAELLGVRQDTVSRVEQRTDMLLSTLQGYVSAMGGELTLLAQFPNRPPVHLKTLGTLKPGRDDVKKPVAKAASG